MLSYVCLIVSLVSFLGEVTEMTPVETENPMGGYGKTVAHVIIGLKTAKGLLTNEQTELSTRLRRAI